MSLTLQDKLALAMTSAGSQRNLAALVGVSHQKIGRWLKSAHPEQYPEGQAAKRGIPGEYADAINQAFRMHAQVSKEQAEIDRIPFNKNAPAFLYRPTRSQPDAQGKPILSDITLADHTNFMRDEVRNKIIQGAQDSGQFKSAVVRSVVELHRYFKQRASEVLNEEKARGVRRTTKMRPQTLAEHMLKDWIDRNRRETGESSIDPSTPFALYTQRQFIDQDNAPKGTRFAVNQINDKLRQKHQTATGPDLPGTVYADQIRLHRFPDSFTSYEKPKRISKRKRKP